MKQCNNRKSQNAFTLIELLIVIAILGILSVSIIAALNVIGNLNKASLARAKTFSSQVENALSINQVGKWSFEEGTGVTSKLYIDGSLDNQDSVSGAISGNANPLRFGCRSDVPPCTGLLNNGFLDEVAIYQEALTSYQIQQLYAQGWRSHLLVQR